MRSALFRPWIWPRWLIALLLIASITGYFLSAVPLTRIAEEHGRAHAGSNLLASFYFPVAVCIEHVPVAEAVAEWQAQFMDWIYGPPGVTTDRVEDAID